ncbi:MAG: Response regulator receiver protein [uncultured bacterium]|uniref:Response regulatory domain-containing protein n=1 Tax=Candidatus Curtissbacteria bacterium RIFOXYA1_FULL_41_14 TaxID=1797737 RepID=A0A1F5HG53_9BACT|nr:MAG: Response regulator receiver protein [uncultured bacterium]KKR56626.1 MAG: Response regulator receiver protein [Candidatus Curtissbacteria bacterium GW2011_GWB1_40_28]KKR75945.1 MAG: Response regulator receiver protein [Candidatus Curtissbacteria bacterium GW2011_GWD1_40_8]KKS01225.1 MAG: Response regulator receiver protein [Candidatus Curtissbacteria bacterium GW2011_GWC2_41_21]OGD79016.1 MAG: hypothetical protein A2683_00670 [Candidatus Curtissbacteria bacterium RIFCSPHIGHO2_01_FULL_34
MAKIIIVEDDLKVANNYRNRLAQEQHDVKIVADVQAINMISTEKPDLVLLDILMPKINGLAILREIKAQNELFDIPFLILTNVEGAQEVQQAIELGASGYLVKADTSLDLLVQKVNDIISAGALGTGVKT